MKKNLSSVSKTLAVDGFRVKDIFFMKKALKLAEKGRSTVSPNPMVGAVFVKNNKIIAEGFHERVGGEHAEVNTLKNLSPQQIKGGVLYVTLEPCRHFGKTPPCTDFLIKKGVRDIVVAMRDPNALVGGKGISQLQNAGVKIKVGVMEKEARQLNEAFIFSIVAKKPFVILKSALTLDGRIATATGNSKWISNEKSRTQVHLLRGRVDAILTSSGTVLADDPHLGVRMTKGKDPLRVIIDSRLRTSVKAQVYRDHNVLVATTTFAAKKTRDLFEKKAITMLTYASKEIPLEKFLKDLYSRGIGSVMIEAGGSLVTALLKEQLVQKGYFFLAPKILGQGINFVGDLGISKINQAIGFENLEIKRYDDDMMLSGNLVYPKR